MGPRVLILSHSFLDRDSRVRRQISALLPDHAVHTAGFSPSGLAVADHINLEQEAVPQDLPVPLRKMVAFSVRARRWVYRDRLKWAEQAYWEGHHRRSLRRLRAVQPHLIIANDLEALPLGVALAAGQCPLIFDAHEFSPRQQDGDPEWMRRFHAYRTDLCRLYMPQAQACFTVSPSIANAYEELTGVKPEVLLNAPPYQDLAPVTTTGGPIALVHHGIATPYRDTEGLVRMMDPLQGTHELHLYLDFNGERGYEDGVRALCAERPHVHLYPAMEPDLIHVTINRFDVGIHHLPPSSFNHLHALPNKLFDFVQARLAIAVGPNPAMADLVKGSGSGVVAAGYTLQDLATAIQGMTRTHIEHYKANAHHQARTLSSQAGDDLLRRTVQQWIGNQMASPARGASGAPGTQADARGTDD